MRRWYNLFLVRSPNRSLAFHRFCAAPSEPIDHHVSDPMPSSGSLLPAGRVRWPRFPHLAYGPHSSRHGSETASSHPAPWQKDVRRGDRGQRPTATKDPNTKQRRRRRRRHCSRVRWPRFPHVAFGPHPSRQWLRNRFFASGPLAKRRSARRPGSATHGYKRSEYETTAQAATPPL